MLTLKEAREQAEKEFTFSDFLDDWYGELRGVFDHQEMEDMQTWQDSLEPRVLDILRESRKCWICEEGTVIEKVDCSEEQPLYYCTCNHCGSDYATSKHIELNKIK